MKKQTYSAKMTFAEERHAEIMVNELFSALQKLGIDAVINYSGKTAFLTVEHTKNIKDGIETLTAFIHLAFFHPDTEIKFNWE